MIFDNSLVKKMKRIVSLDICRSNEKRIAEEGKIWKEKNNNNHV